MLKTIRATKLIVVHVLTCVEKVEPSRVTRARYEHPTGPGKFMLNPLSMPKAADIQPDEIGSRLGRAALEVPGGIRYLHTSIGLAWKGGFLTHVLAPPGSFKGTWSTLRVTATLSHGRVRFRRHVKGSLSPPLARLRIGLPGEPESGCWDSTLETVSLFVDPRTAGDIYNVPYSEDAALRAAASRGHDLVVDRLLQALLAHVIEAQDDEPIFGETVISAILQTFGRAPPRPPATSVLSNRALRGLHGFITENLRSTMHLKDLADQVGMSSRHLCRSLKATLGIAPHRYVVECRLDYARQLLVGSSMSIEAVAEAAGFADRSHMSATFRRILDLTPAQIRGGSR